MAKEKIGVKGFLKSRWFFLVAIAYVLSPIDLIPDFLAGIGSLDDTALLVIELIRQYSEYQKRDA